MTQPPNPQTPSSPQQQPAGQSFQQPNSPRPAKSKAGKWIENVLIEIWEPIDIFGKNLMTEFWWRNICEGIQETIGTLAYLSLPGLLGWIFFRENFSGFNICIDKLNKNSLEVAPYMCFITVASEFLALPIVVLRIYLRLKKNFSSLNRS
jgi:hypothetical protein